MLQPYWPFSFPYTKCYTASYVYNYRDQRMLESLRAREKGLRDNLKGLRKEKGKLLELQLIREQKDEKDGSGNCLHIYGGSSRGTMPFTAVA